MLSLLSIPEHINTRVITVVSSFLGSGRRVAGRHLRPVERGSESAFGSQSRKLYTQHSTSSVRVSISTRALSDPTAGLHWIVPDAEAAVAALVLPRRNRLSVCVAVEQFSGCWSAGPPYYTTRGAEAIERALDSARTSGRPAARQTTRRSPTGRLHRHVPLQSPGDGRSTGVSTTL
jgi:hypothetical protein